MVGMCERSNEIGGLLAAQATHVGGCNNILIDRMLLQMSQILLLLLCAALECAHFFEVRKLKLSPAEQNLLLGAVYGLLKCKIGFELC